MVLNGILIFPLAAAGLALATALSGMLNAWLLYRGLRKDRVYQPHPGWRRLWIQVGCATAFMALVLAHAGTETAFFLKISGGQRALVLGGWIVVGLAAYGTVIWFMGLRPHALRLKSTGGNTGS